MLRTRGQGREAKDRIGEGGGEAKERKKPHMRCIRDVGNGGDLGGDRKKRRQESVGSVAADPDNLDNSKGAGTEVQGTQGLRTVQVDRVCPLCRV